MTTLDRASETQAEAIELAKLPPKPGFSWQRVGVPIAAVLIALFCLAPILWQLLTSVKVNADISAVPTVYFPTRFFAAFYQPAHQ